MYSNLESLNNHASAYTMHNMKKNNNLITESEVVRGKSLTETLLRW